MHYSPTRLSASVCIGNGGYRGAGAVYGCRDIYGFLVTGRVGLSFGGKPFGEDYTRIHTKTHTHTHTRMHACIVHAYLHLCLYICSTCNKICMRIFSEWKFFTHVGICAAKKHTRCYVLFSDIHMHMRAHIPLSSCMIVKVVCVPCISILTSVTSTHIRRKRSKYEVA